MNFSPQQRTALRTVADREPLSSIDPRTFRSLLKNGLIYRTRGTSASRAHWALTSQGEMVHEDIMASGDGPEDLKAMFRF